MDKIKKFVHLSDDEKEYIRRHASTMTPKELADYIGCTRNTAYNYAKMYGADTSKKPYKWSRDKAEKLIHQFNTGVSVRLMAEKANMLPVSIHVLVRQLGRRYNIPVIPRREQKRRAKNADQDKTN